MDSFILVDAVTNRATLPMNAKIKSATIAMKLVTSLKIVQRLCFAVLVNAVRILPSSVIFHGTLLLLAIYILNEVLVITPLLEAEADRVETHTSHQQSPASEEVSAVTVDISADEPAVPILVEESTAPDARILISEGLIVTSPDFVPDS